MKTRDIAGTVLLLAYLMCVGFLTGPSLGQLMLGRLPEPRLELIPFADIVKVLTDTRFGVSGVIANIAGNVLLFLPLGMLLPLFWTYFRKAGRTVFCGFAISLSIELIQITAGGVTSVDDVILNTLGAALGFAVSKLFTRGGSHMRRENRLPWVYPLICWMAVIIIYTVQDFGFLAKASHK